MSTAQVDCACYIRTCSIHTISATQHDTPPKPPELTSRKNHASPAYSVYNRRVARRPFANNTNLCTELSRQGHAWPSQGQQPAETSKQKQKCKSSKVRRQLPLVTPKWTPCCSTSAHWRIAASVCPCRYRAVNSGGYVDESLFGCSPRPSTAPDSAANGHGMARNAGGRGSPDARTTFLATLKRHPRTGPAGRCAHNLLEWAAQHQNLSPIKYSLTFGTNIRWVSG